VLSDVRADLNGVVFFTTYTPNTDVCLPGGSTSMWAVKYDTGGAAPLASLGCKMPLQTSGGGITLIDCQEIFKDKLNRKIDKTKVKNKDGTANDGTTDPLPGMASKDRGTSIKSNPARRKIMHSQER
jgi:Tfp pilus tip-associated adhesin PilY1